MELINKEKNTQVMKTFGLNSISGFLPKVRYGELKQEFSPAMQEEWAKLKCRPTGVFVDLLVGSESISLHPIVHETQGNMVAKRSRFGNGFLLNGTSPQLKTSNCLQPSG